MDDYDDGVVSADVYDCVEMCASEEACTGSEVGECTGSSGLNGEGKLISAKITVGSSLLSVGGCAVYKDSAAGHPV